MDTKIDPVSLAEKETLWNLLEKYNYEFSQYEQNDVGDSGLYGYDYFEPYWTEKGRYPFLIRVGGKLAGFIMINDYPVLPRQRMDFSMAEFFILYKYRKQGVGSYAAQYVFDRFKGLWQLKAHPKNISSLRFWEKTIRDYTGGAYEVIHRCPEVMYEDGSAGEVFLFET